MDLIQAIKNRKSIRDFKPDKVPREMIYEILEIAINAPSGVNKQPWEFTVIAGDVLDRIRADNMQGMHILNPGTGLAEETVYRKRQVDLAMELYRLMGISREDNQKRLEWLQRGFCYFNAPAAIILMTDKSLLPGADGTEIGSVLNSTYLDLGAVMQTICLAALHYGLATCIEGQGVMQPEVLRRHVAIPDSKVMVIAIAIGYPNWDFPANQIDTPREPVDNLTIWSGF